MSAADLAQVHVQGVGRMSDSHQPLIKFGARLAQAYGAHVSARTSVLRARHQSGAHLLVAVKPDSDFVLHEGARLVHTCMWYMSEKTVWYMRIVYLCFTSDARLTAVQVCFARQALGFCRLVWYIVQHASGVRLMRV